jgi:hypothetical protein
MDGLYELKLNEPVNSEADTHLAERKLLSKLGLRNDLARRKLASRNGLVQNIERLITETFVVLRFHRLGHPTLLHRRPALGG